ncbi:hypothetical protein NQ318_018868 [Aromia moschata]|uniref:CHK kinase-like domain-containing protein n=1 Tax=Aromia moschata TaxID=1265417 RepID=A0AAV8ZHN1_9CUCU|nr:hypothetical protein NQ318_018868 [Aromia moschata]
MSENVVIEEDLLALIKKSLEHEDIENYEVVLTGKTQNGEGYVGDIIFADVLGTTKDNRKRKVSLAVKRGTSNEHLKKTAPVRKAFETEIHFYSEVVPAFKTLELEHKIEDVFDSVPKCYQTLLTDSTEALVFNNLREIGYQMHDRAKPLNLQHQKKILTEYGKLHALSFALRDQHPEKFNSLVSDRDVIRDFLSMKHISDSYQNGIDKAMDMLRENGDFVLENKMRQVFSKHVGEIFSDLFATKETQTAILHADGWNNNYLFQYENDDRTSPSKVMILDWQISAVRSPVFDISFLIYITGSSAEIERFDELLATYYDSFSSYLRKLGSHPEKLFPFTALEDHWKKYSLYGLVSAPAALTGILGGNPASRNGGEDLGITELLNLNMLEKEKYLFYERISSIFRHYCKSAL